MSCLSLQELNQHDRDMLLRDESLTSTNVIPMFSSKAAKVRAIGQAVAATCRMRGLTRLDTRIIVSHAKQAYRQGHTSPAMAIAKARAQARLRSNHGAEA